MTNEFSYLNCYQICRMKSAKIEVNIREGDKSREDGGIKVLR